MITMNKVTELQAHLKLIVEMFYKAKEPFKAQAFNKVATQLGRFKSLEMTDGKLVTKIPGVGDAIRDVIEQFTATGTSAKYKMLAEKVGAPVAPDRQDAKVVKAVVEKLFKPLTIHCVDWSFAGSMRRGNETVKDIDIVICLAHDSRERSLVHRLLLEAGLKADVRDGQEKLGVTLPLPDGNSITMDINFCTPANRGAMMLYLTGPASYNIDMRTTAKKMGLTLNQHGLFRGKQLIAAASENMICAELGLEYKKPEERF